MAVKPSGRALHFTMVIAASLIVARLTACSTFVPANDDDAGSGLDASTTDAEGSAPDGQAADGPTADGGIHCGSSLCVPRAEVCCAEDSGLSCRAPSACGGTKYGCTEAANCVEFGPGAVCCVALNNDVPDGSACSADVTCGQTYHDLLCRPDESPACPAGATCVATSAYPDLPLVDHCSGYPRLGP